MERKNKKDQEIRQEIRQEIKVTINLPIGIDPSRGIVRVFSDEISYNIKNAALFGEEGKGIIAFTHKLGGFVLSMEIPRDLSQETIKDYMIKKVIKIFSDAYGSA
jgi:hypothetical protein